MSQPICHVRDIPEEVEIELRQGGGWLCTFPARVGNGRLARCEPVEDVVVAGVLLLAAGVALAGVALRRGIAGGGPGSEEAGGSRGGGGGERWGPAPAAEACGGEPVEHLPADVRYGVVVLAAPLRRCSALAFGCCWRCCRWLNQILLLDLTPEGCSISQ